MSTARRRSVSRLVGGEGHRSPLLIRVLRWIILGSGVGVIAGLSSAALLVALEWATETRVDNGWIVWFLPVAGLTMGCMYHYTGGRSAEGNNLIIDEIHEPDAGVPRRMAPLIFVSTFVTQLFGGSAGREGTGIQLSVSLGDAVARLLPLTRDQRRILMIAGVSAGFGALFGVPLAGAVFGIEVQSVGRIKYDAVVPSLTGALVGDLVVRGLGVTHMPTPELGAIDLSVGVILKLAVAGIVFGLVSAIFVSSTRLVKAFGARVATWPPARPLIGGALVLAMMVAFGTREYLGLSLPLAESALGGNDTSASVFALKLLFTVITLGFGFYGGEVTPLLVIGATLGAALAPLFGLPIALVAAVGYVAVFAGAASVPLACTIMAVELFGLDALVPAAIACAAAYIFSSHRSIYTSARTGGAKQSWKAGLPDLLRGSLRRRPAPTPDL
ncbi:unannotated protein [freshwater metagenome]|uniref:Unannotated protein n=1 Tax=freshwater metagenome TaxID=449393 RepID=A0A6J6GHK7_9ZZZZ|nr:voltage-gated chloride channel protein [Actinomycetota bacterium]